MIIKELKLNNIRSYSDSLISIPEGSTLLSGNIGSGKSSILLAIDFALFGLRQRELSGNGLLRNGEDSGSVELEFEIEENSIKIKRTLKRANKSVSQDTGFLFINGKKESLSAIELKERILNILGYPKILLTKSKNLIFRYTVYTPQEEMREILTGDQDMRLDTLRKVFGIDKYKRIKENSRIILSNLRETKREIEGRISDLDRRVEEKNNKIKEREEINVRLKELAPKIEEVKDEIKKKKEEIKEIEEKIEILNNIKREFSVNQNSIISKKERISKNKNELNSILKFIIENKNLEIPDYGPLRKKVQEKEVEISILEKEALDLSLSIRESNVKKKSSEELISKINSLDICPVCKQEVNENHKHFIKETEKNVIIDSEDKIKRANEKEALLRGSLKTLKEEVENLKGEERNIQLKIFQKSRLEEKVESKNKIERENTELEKEILALEESNNNLEIKIESLSKINYAFVKSEFESILLLEKELEIEKISHEKEIRRISIDVEKIELEIKNKLKEKESLTRLNKIIFFINEHFSDLMDNMEKKVMLKVHSDFDAFFQKWFFMLVDDEILNVKLDESFAPVIEQQGHDIDYAYLSGGERTAAALAYRLAINQAISKIITKVKTKDLIILDEPTDGFSSEQLDKMKYVIDELEARQIIIVSHDPKIESFVDNVIRIEKQNGITRIN